MRNPILAVMGALLLGTAAHGQVNITYSLTGNSYSYTVENVSLGLPIDFFTIFFPDLSSEEAADYSGVTALSTPSGWAANAQEPFPPDLGGYVDWFVDAAPGIGTGESLGGFEASFNYAGSGAPGSQFFAVYDENFEVIASGYTRPTFIEGVPESGSWLVSLLALGSILGLSRLTLPVKLLQ